MGQKISMGTLKHQVELYKHQMELALGKKHGAKKVPVDVARYMARCGFSISYGGPPLSLERLSRGLNLDFPLEVRYE